jgi:hypothetical protein
VTAVTRTPGRRDVAAGFAGPCRPGRRFRGAPWLTAHVTHNGGMGDSPAEGAEVVDDELTRILHVHGQVLEEQSRTLVITGTASICMPGILLRARLRVPRRWRKGLLEVTSEDPSSGEALGTCTASLGRVGHNRGSLSLADEITIRLAGQVADGPSTQGKHSEG